jgi:hypothetical protein
VTRSTASKMGRGVRPSAEGREQGRHRQAGTIGADTVVVTQEPGQLDGQKSPEVRVDCPETGWDWHRLRDEAGALRHR